MNNDGDSSSTRISIRMYLSTRDKFRFFRSLFRRERMIHPRRSNLYKFDSTNDHFLIGAYIFSFSFLLSLPD